ncbi:GtrA family protein [Rhizobiaceae bacterium BDR2-2]|uniref:GtrA family protein n=1 Tax=Ectorhizobium quercum TaxID=2965071 RepID=A0AAE3N2K7_9HYPH|nr:GtrA family protein [Ectorhizobium quercum]MCX8996185.1 GtrA family protein [Ectorhizobium quercum]MCX8998776.1 GtrA family protein [Ectorhizobium quercum]
MKRIARFAIVGGGGFLVDALVLSALLHFTPADPFLARIAAIAAAMSFTFVLNRSYTFGRSNRRMLSESIRYGTVGTVTALFNYGFYAALLIGLPGLQPLAALVFASAAAMGLSFVGYSRLVFARR